MIERDLIEFLQENLSVTVECDSDYFGTPEVHVSLLLFGKCISKSDASIPEHRHDSDDW